MSLDRGLVVKRVREENRPSMALRVSLVFARSRQDLRWSSRRVSSMPSWSRRRVTMSTLPREAARWRGVVPEAGG